jgi:hypothetical protein
MERFDNLHDVIVHNVTTKSDGITHVLSLELYLTEFEIVFQNITIVTSRNKEILIFLSPKLSGVLNATR